MERDLPSSDTVTVVSSPGMLVAGPSITRTATGGDVVTKTVILILTIAVALIACQAPMRSATAAGCGSSWAICRYRVWVRTHTPAEYQARQQRLAAKCTPRTVWWDACR